MKYKGDEFNICRADRVDIVMEKGDKVSAIVKLPGWYKDQKICVAKDRLVTILNCDKNENSKVNVNIISSTGGVYIGK